MDMKNKIKNFMRKDTSFTEVLIVPNTKQIQVIILSTTKTFKQHYFSGPFAATLDERR